MDVKKPYRSLFWPILLITAGVLWLLSIMGVISRESISSVLALWPLILIIIGLDMIFGRSSPVIGAIIALIAVIAVLVALIAGPAIGWNLNSTMKHQSIEEPIGAALQTEISFDFGSLPVEVYPLSNPNQLIQAEIDYFGSLNFSASGSSTNRRITLSESSQTRVFTLADINAEWRIGLTPNLPIDLRIDAGSGTGNLDLSTLRLTALRMDQGSGSYDVFLPPSTQAYTVEIDGGSGRLEVTLPQQGDITIIVDGASGSIRFNVPDGLAVRLEVRDEGSGSVSRSNRLNLVSDGEGDRGIWESAGYEQAEHRVLIRVVELGSGSINIR